MCCRGVGDEGVGENEFPCAVLRSLGQCKMHAASTSPARHLGLVCAGLWLMPPLSTQRYKEGGDPVVLLEPLKDRGGKSAKR